MAFLALAYLSIAAAASPEQDESTHGHHRERGGLRDGLSGSADEEVLAAGVVKVALE